MKVYGGVRPAVCSKMSNNVQYLFIEKTQLYILAFLKHAYTLHYTMKYSDIN